MSEEQPNGVPKIYTVLPDEIRNMHPHGQWSGAAPGWVINFATDIIDGHFPDIEPWARKLEEFRKSDEDFMEFESPHLPGVCYLHRSALDLIVLTQPAWSAKVMARQSKGVQLMDAESGVPLIRKFPGR